MTLILTCGSGCLNCHDLQVVDIICQNRASSPTTRKLPFGFSLSAEAYRIFAFFILAKAAEQICNHDLKVVAI